METHNLQAEQSVVGALLIDAERVLPEIIDVVHADDFYIPLYREIFEYVLSLTERGQKVDTVTLAEAMRDKTDRDVAKELLLCADMVPSLANAKAYAQIVTKTARARRLQQIISSMAQSTLTAENVDSEAERLMDALFRETKARKGGLQPFRQAVTQWYSSLFEPRPDRVDTGFGDLDKVLQGMCAGNLVLLAARPGVGKTALAAQIAERAAASGKAVNFYSCEMENGEIIERLAARESGVDMDALISGVSRDADAVPKLAAAADRLVKLPFNISDDASITIPQIRAQCRMTANLGLIVVDYIQLLKATNRCENRNVEVGEISRGLKLLANDLKVPVLALSQMSRDIEKRGAAQKEPQLSDLRDSGSLEQDANKILLMWQVGGDEKKPVVAVRVAKNRRGRTGEVQFIFDGAHMRHIPILPDQYIRHTAPRLPRGNEF